MEFHHFSAYIIDISSIRAFISLLMVYDPIVNGIDIAKQV